MNKYASGFIRLFKKDPNKPKKKETPLSLALAVLAALTIRWLLVESYVIPSGSMLPSLLLHDYIFVNKIVYGIRVPFSKAWMMKFKPVERGEILVFKSPDEEGIFLIKRVIGVPGDKISWDGQQLTLNGEKVPTQENPDKEKLLSIVSEEGLGALKSEVNIFREDLPNHPHPTIVQTFRPHKTFENIEVPPDTMFMMGDNRDNSKDSRYFGFAPQENILGRAMFVWLSCEDTLPGILSFLCNPAEIRWSRLLHNIK